MNKNEWRENMQMAFGLWERRYKNNYPLLIEKIAHTIGKGGKRVVLILEVIADALEKAQINPTKENWEKLKKVLLENQPEDN